MRSLLLAKFREGGESVSSEIVASKQMSIHQNVMIRVLDASSGQVVQQHCGHNNATNSMLLGLGHYLLGDGVLGQGNYTLNQFIPKYISLGTMGLYGQGCDEYGLPTAIGGSVDEPEESRFLHYMQQRPGYGADGYDPQENNSREYFGLGLPFSETNYASNCELITPDYARASISFRDLVPERYAEIPQTVDVIYSALISTGALKQFRPEEQDYLFISEAGLWSVPTWDWDSKNWLISGSNGLLAGYRIAPPNEDNWDMSQETNREILKQNILRVGINQVVQVIWKLQIGSIDQFGGRIPVGPEPEPEVRGASWGIATSDVYNDSVEII